MRVGEMSGVNRRESPHRRAADADADADKLVPIARPWRLTLM
jgi:hypothetical protein